ncbi:MAG: hypothetical protein ACFFD2_23050, partial [Promethearchaeota archaeon]
MNKKISEINVYHVLDNYFKLLDSASIKSDGFFRQEEDKDHYETLFMYSFRKFQAAEYHYSNVLNFLIRDFKSEKVASIKAELLDSNHKSKGWIVSAKTTTEISSNYYVYELSAFLEALKSSIDFLAAACEIHLKGINLDSISSLIRLVLKGKTGPILNQVKKHLVWLEYVRSYRHHLVHRKLFTISSITKSIYNGTKESKIHSPIVIPKKPPNYTPDTRKNRLLRNNIGLEIPYIESTVTIDDKIIDYNLEYQITEDYISIEEFMKNNLFSFNEFF